MHKFEVGKQYSPTRSSWPEGIEYNYITAGHELRLFMNNLSKQEIHAVKQGQVEFALAVEGDIILFLFEIKGGFDWSDCPYNINIVPEELRQTPPTLGENERALLQIFLVEAKSGILRAMRQITFSPEFTQKLHDLINQQLAKPITRASYDQQVTRIQAQIPTQVLLSRAVARCIGGKQ